MVETCLAKYGVENVFQNTEIKEKALKSYQETLNSGKHFGYKKVSKTNLDFAKKLTSELDIAEEAVIFEYALEGLQYDLKIDNVLIDINPTVSHNQHKAFPCFLKKCATPCKNHPPVNFDCHYKRAEVAKKHRFSLIQVYDWNSEAEIVRAVEQKLRKHQHLLFAEDLELRALDFNDVESFLKEERITSLSPAPGYHYGLCLKGEILSVASFTPLGDRAKEFEFQCYETKRGYIIAAAVERLWRKFCRDVRPEKVTSHINFDLTTEPVTLLEKLGFVELAPSGPFKVWSKGKKKVQGFAPSLFGDFNSDYRQIKEDEAMIATGWLPVSVAGYRIFQWLSAEQKW